MLSDFDSPKNGDSHPDSEEREITVHGHVFTLIARRGEEGKGWTSRILVYSMRSDSALFRHPVLDDRSSLHDKAAIVRDFRGEGTTKKEALDSLEATLRAVIAQAVRPDDVANRT